MARLIDADALIPLIQKDKIEGENLDIIKALGNGLQAETLNQACDRHIKIINSLPTIQAEPVRHGEWLWDDHYGHYKCSECKDFYPHNTTVILNNGFKFCPNCGLKMDGGV